MRSRPGTTVIAALLLAAPVLVHEPPILASESGSSPGTASASLAPTGQQARLRTIAHVHATTAFCRSTLLASDDVIAAALNYDVDLSGEEDTLRQVELDKSALTKAAGLTALNAEYATLQAFAAKGEAALAELRLQAVRAPTDQQRQALLKFTDALGSAVGKQEALAGTLGSMLTILQNRPLIDEQAHQQMIANAIRDQNSPSAHQPAVVAHGDDDVDSQLTNQKAAQQDSLYVKRGGSDYGVLVRASDIAKNDASDIEQRALPVLTDENTAADLIDPAFAACLNPAPHR